MTQQLRSQRRACAMPHVRHCPPTGSGSGGSSACGSFLSFCLVVALLSCVAAAQPAPAGGTGPAYTPVTTGTPVYGSLPRGGAAFFRLIAPLSAGPKWRGLPAIQAVALPASGSIGLYATAGDFWDPAPGNSEWVGAGTFGPCILNVPANVSFTALGGTCDASRVNTTTCYINVGIYAARASNFSLTLTLGSGSDALALDVPTVGVLPASDGASARRLFNLSLPAAAGITFTASPVDATASIALYVSSSSAGSPTPDPALPASYCASATEANAGILSGSVAITLPPTSPCACAPAAPACVYYAAVLRASGSPAPPSDVVFSVLATTGPSQAVPLVTGLPSRGMGTSGSVSLFTYAADLDPSGTSAPPAATFTLTPLQGGVRLFITVGPSTGPPAPGSATYSSGGGPGTQVINICASDAMYAAACPIPAQQCALTLSVLTLSASSAWSLEAESGTAGQLSDGQPVEGSVPGAGAVAPFAFAVPFAGRSLRFTAAALSGEVQIFVGCDSNNATTSPNPAIPGSWMWMGDAAVLVDAADPAACAPPCSYYVGVVSADASRSAAFVLMARTNASTAPTPLILGDVLLDVVPLAAPGTMPGQVPFNSYVFLYDPTAASVNLALFNVQGGSAVYAALANGSVPAVSPAQYAYTLTPTGTAAWEGFDITPTDTAFVAACGVLTPSSACFVAVAVAGNSTGQGALYAQYLLTASSGIRQMVDAVPVTGTVQDSTFAYFRYTAYAPTHFTVTATPLNGQPDLVMSVRTLPNATSSQWSSVRAGGEVLSVQWTEPWLDPSRNPTSFPMDFFIGVAGYGGAAEFTLLVDSNPFIVLADGVPQVALGSPAALTYFVFQLPPIGPAGELVGFSLALTPLSGDPSPLMYVNTVNHTTTPVCSHCGWPYCRSGPPCDASDIGNYNRHWSSEESRDAQYVEVDVTDPNYEAADQYVVAVLCAQAACEFSLTATYSDEASMLINQIPMFGAVGPGEYHWYALDIIHISVALTVVVTPLDGLPELYVSVNSTVRRPTNSSYSKAAVPDGSGGSGGVLAVYFTWAELPECPDSSVNHVVYCHIYIGVLGGSGVPAVYTVMADAARPNVTELLLVDGVPTSNVIVQGDIALYYALVAVGPTTEYSVTLNPHGTAKVDLFATTDGSRPSPTNFQFASIGVNGPEQVNIAPSDPWWISNGTLRVAVDHPFQDQVGYDVTYEANALSTLLPGSPAPGNTQVTQVRYYSVLNGGSGDVIDVSMTGASGTPVLYVGIQPPGNTTYRPTRKNACALWTGGGTLQTLLVLPGDACYCASACTYVVAVACDGIPYFEPTCRFMLVASTNSGVKVQLTDGSPIAEVVMSMPTVAAGRSFYKYFSLDLSIMLQAGGNLSVTAFSTNGLPVQILGLTSPGGYSTLGNAAWNSNATGPPSIAAGLLIAYNDPVFFACPTCTTLTLAVCSPPLPSGAETGAPAVLTFVLTAASTVGTPERLLLGAPSAPYTGAYRSTKTWVVYLPDGGAAFDLIVAPTVLAGRYAYTVSPTDPNAGCTIGVAPARIINCTGTWQATDGGPLRIETSRPCANAALPGCDPATVWRPGPYYISVVLRYSPTTIIMNARQPDCVIMLEAGVPSIIVAASDTPPIAQYAVAFDPAAPPVRIIFSADALPATYYLTSCVSGTSGCTATGSARPSPSNPLPGQLSGVVPAQSTVALMLSAGSPGGCLDPSGAGAVCLFLIIILPPTICPPVTCAATVTVVASTESGSTPIDVPWSTIDGRVAVLGGASLPTSASRQAVQLFLSPLSTGAVGLATTVFACGASDASTALWPALFACDPAVAAADGGCVNPFAPSPSTSTGSARTGAGGAIASYTLDSTSAPTLVAAVFGLPSQAHVSAAASVGLAFELSLSSGPAVYLTAGAGSVLRPAALAITATVASGAALTLSWPPAVLSASDGSSNLTATGASYTLLLAPVGFGPSTPAGMLTVPGTACGLEAWAALAGAVPGAILFPLRIGAVSVDLSSVTGVLIGATYEGAILASCDASCGGAARRYAAQRVAYGSKVFVAGAQGPPPGGPPSGPPLVVVIGGAVGGVALLALGAFAARKYSVGGVRGVYGRLGGSSAAGLPAPLIERLDMLDSTRGGDYSGSMDDGEGGRQLGEARAGALWMPRSPLMRGQSPAAMGIGASPALRGMSERGSPGELLLSSV
jgi:hypothetical protein